MTPEQFVVAAGIMSALAVAALDGTVVSTAMPIERTKPAIPASVRVTGMSRKMASTSNA